METTTISGWGHIVNRDGHCTCGWRGQPEESLPHGQAMWSRGETVAYSRTQDPDLWYRGACSDCGSRLYHGWHCSECM